MSLAWVEVIFGLVLLLTGAEALVRGAVGVALRLKISAAIVGLTIVAFGTSLPELVISLIATSHAKDGLAVGTVVGSNFFNLGMILGISALLRPMVVDIRTLKAEYPVLIGATLGTWLLARDGHLDALDGTFMVGAAAAGLALLAIAVKKGWVGRGVEDEPRGRPMSLVRATALILIGGVFLYFGAERTVEGASVLAKSWGWSERVIGLTIVAFGTSAPELAVSVVAAVRKQAGIAIGNVIGSCILNLLMVWGLTSMIRPFDLSATTLERDYLWMMGITVLLLPLMLIRRSIGRVDGVILIAAFLVFYGVIFFG